jgi:cellulose biosynthesis protein BcsQ
MGEIMATVICMASAKGGSGKTVLTATFGAMLSALGKRVLAIDTDAATNGLSLMFLKESRIRAEYAWSKGQRPLGIYDMNLSSQEPSVVSVGQPFGIDVIPATYHFINTEEKRVEEFELSLLPVVEWAKRHYDFIFLDAQAGSDAFAHVSMQKGISDQVVIVSEYDPLSAAGVERLKGVFREDLTYDRTWVLLNKVLPEFVKSFSDFMEVAKYASPIPWDADVVRAYARRRLALDFERGNSFTLAILQTLRSIGDDSIESDIDSWLEQQAEELRVPLNEQLETSIREYEALARAEREMNRRMKIRGRLQNLWMFGSSAGMASLGVWAAVLMTKEGSGGGAAAGRVGYIALSFIGLVGLSAVLSKWMRDGGEDDLGGGIGAQQRGLVDRIHRLRELIGSSPEAIIRRRDEATMHDYEDEWRRSLARKRV